MKLAIIRRPDNSIAVIIPNHHKFTDAETDAAWFANEAIKSFGIPDANGDLVSDGSQVVMDDDEAVVRAALPFADRSPNASASRTFRRNAMRWNPLALAVEDDLRLTTEQEIVEAIALDQEVAIGKPDANRTGAERKLAAGRPDLLDVDDMDDTVVRWRGSGKAPPPSSFVPPADRIKPQPPPRRR